MWTVSWLEEGEEKAVEVGGREGRKGREMGDRREEGDREGIEGLGRKGKVEVEVLNPISPDMY